MSQPLAHCPVHGIYPARAISVENSTGITFAGVTETCPRCGRVSEIVDGTYDFHQNGTFDAVLRPTPAQARRLQTVIEWAKTRVEDEPEQTEAVADHVEKALRKEWAGIGPVLDALGSKRGLTAATWLGVLIALVSLLVSAQSDSLSMEDIQSVLEDVQQSQPQQNSPAPRPDIVPLGDDNSTGDITS